MIKPTPEAVGKLATEVNNSTKKNLRALITLRSFCVANDVPTESLLQILTDLNILIFPGNSCSSRIGVIFSRSPYYPGNDFNVKCQLTSEPPIRHAICHELCSYDKEILSFLYPSKINEKDCITHGFDNKKLLGRYRKALKSSGIKYE